MKTVIRNSYTPKLGEYCNTLVVDKETGNQYLFDKDGVWTLLSTDEEGIVEEAVAQANAYTDDVAEGKVDKEEGKGLSENDFTDEDKDKLDGIEEGAQENVIEVVKRNGTALPVTDKTVDVAVPTATSALTNDSGYITNAVDDLVNYYDKDETDTLLETEALTRDGADQELQEQIDALAASSDVVDIVGTYAELQNYDTTKLHDNDIIKVLTDESRGGATAYYRWDDDTDAFTYIGSEGPYYTKGETDATFVPLTRTINGKGLNSDVVLTAADVGALPSSTVIPTVNNATLTIQKNGSSVATFTANSATNATANITVPTKTSDLTNDGADNTSTYVEADELATVATTGSYNDLTDKPTIDFELVEMSYGESNAWAKFIAAYQGHKIVYCRASSNSNPATGTQGRKAFMAYVDNAENPTEVEFQYVRSVSSKTSSQPVDQVYVYKLTSASGGTWTVQTRDMGPKLAQGANTTVSYSNGTYTISATQPMVNDATLTIQKNGTTVETFTANSASNKTANITVPTKTSDITNDSGFIDKDVNNLTNYYTETQVNSMFNALTIPTKTSDLTNDSGFVSNTDYASANSAGVVKVGTGLSIDSNGVLSSTGTQSTAWADITGQPTDVSYWNNDAGYITSAALPTKTSDLTNDSGFITSASLPTKTSDLTNDSGFITNSVNNLTNYYTKSETYSQGEVNSLLSAIVIPTKTSDLQNDGSDGTAAYLETDETAYRTTSIPYGACDGTSTSTAFTATVPGITELRDGVCMWLKNGVVTSASGFTININNLGAKPVYSNMAAASADTTIFNANYTMFFVYDSTRVSGGCWVLYRGYNSDNNTIGYQLRTNSTALTVTDRTRYYRLLFTSADNTQWVPANTQYDNSATSSKTVNQRKINPFGRIVYVSASTNFPADTAVTATAVWDQYALALGYSFAKGSALTMTFPKPVYIKCAPQSDGSAIIDSTNPYVQDLPSTDDGKIYIYLGMAYSATNVEMVINHPVYYYKDGAIREWTNATVGISSVSWDDVTNKPTFATVATSGSYDDLDDKPTIPTVNDATLTIQKNGVNVQTFTANASSNKTANITVPTTVAELSDSSNYATASDLAAKQDALTVGNHISISNDTISAIDYVHSENPVSVTSPTPVVTGSMIAPGTITASNIAAGETVTLTLSTTDIGEGAPLATNTLYGVYQ